MRDAFLQHVLESPDDDAPRLVFADWLDDHGDADRAEFIRVQCRLARMTASNPEAAGLRKREADLLAEHALTWAEPFRGKAHAVGFDRGFVDFVHLEPRHRAGLAGLFSLTPLTSLLLDEFGPDVPFAMLELGEALGRVRYLHLAGLDECQDEHLRALFQSPLLLGLGTLFIDQAYLDEFPSAAIEAIGEYHCLGGLEHLGLAIGNESQFLPNYLLHSIADSSVLRLRGFYGYRFAPPAGLFRRWLRSPACRGLERLWLHQPDLPPTADELIAPDVLPRLRELYYGGTFPDSPERALLTGRYGPEVVDFDSEHDNFFPSRQGILLPG